MRENGLHSFWGCHAAALMMTVLLVVNPFSEAAVSDAGHPSAESIRAVLAETPPSDLRIVAIRVGVADRARRNLFIADPSLPRRIEVAFSFWVVAGEGRVMLVDTGFVNRTMIENWRIEKYRNPVDAFRDAGFDPKDITDIIITHTHWDHIGGLAEFPDAEIWISKRAVPRLKRKGGGWLVRLLRRARSENRLHIIDEVQQVAPSVAVVPTGLHAPGFQYIVVKKRDGIWVLASDVAPLWANFERKKSTGQTTNKKKTLRVQEIILELVDGNLNRIIPGHEPKIFDSARTGHVELVE